MTRLKTLLFAAILFVGTSSLATAQSKMAHINTTELVQAMPEMKTAQVEIEKLTKTYDAQIKEMATELQNKIKQYRSEVDTKTQEENDKRALEVQEMEQGIRQFQGQAQQDLAKKEEALLKPIFEKAKAAIQKVANAQGLEYVLDSTQGGGVLVAKGKDLMADVKQELGF
ncbi:MAG: OmpH family outer membrane protein [Bacteroidota bacterium]